MYRQGQRPEVFTGILGVKIVCAGQIDLFSINLVSINLDCN